MNLLDTGQTDATANNNDFAASTTALHQNKQNKNLLHSDDKTRIKKPPDKMISDHNSRKTQSSKFKRIFNLFSKDKNSDLLNSAKPPGLFERNIRTTSITSLTKNYSEKYPDKLHYERNYLGNHCDNRYDKNKFAHDSTTTTDYSSSHNQCEKSLSGYGSSGVGTCDHTMDEDNSSVNNSSIGEKNSHKDGRSNEGSSSNGYGSYVSNSSRNASVSSVGNQSDRRSYNYHKPKIFNNKHTEGFGKENNHKSNCTTDEYSNAESNSKRCTEKNDEISTKDHGGHMNVIRTAGYRSWSINSVLKTI